MRDRWVTMEQFTGAAGGARGFVINPPFGGRFQLLLVQGLFRNADAITVFGQIALRPDGDQQAVTIEYYTGDIPVAGSTSLILAPGASVGGITPPVALENMTSAPLPDNLWDIPMFVNFRVLAGTWNLDQAFIAWREFGPK